MALIAVFLIIRWFFFRSFKGVLASLKENKCTIVHGTEYIIDRSVHGQLTEKFAKQDMNYCPLLWFVWERN